MTISKRNSGHALSLQSIQVGIGGNLLHQGHNQQKDNEQKDNRGAILMNWVSRIRVLVAALTYIKISQRMFVQIR